MAVKINEENLQKRIKFFPHEGQQKILNSNSRLKVICAGRRFGKTMYAAYEVVLEALQGNKLIWTVGPDYDLARVVFEQVHMYLELILEPKSFSYEKKPIPRIKIQNGSVIECKSGKNKKGMLGRATDLIVVDEAARLDDDVWYQYLKPTTHDKGAKTIMISTPTGLNWFYDMWAEAGRGQFHFKSTDNPYFSEEEWEDVLKTTPKSRIQQEYLANFLADGTSVFQGIEEIIDGDFEQPREGIGYLIGVDLAKQDDFTACVVMERATRKVVWIDRFNDMDYSIQKKRIVALSKKYNSAKIIIDSSGPGDPIAEDIKRMVFTEAVSMHSAKVKQQLIEKLQIFIEQRLITIPNHEELIKELRQYASYSTESGIYRRFSAPKHKHDDIVMALALAVYGVYAHNVNDDSDNEDVIRRRRLRVFNDYE